MQDASTRPIDLFVHIPKTAGTTMTQVLKHNYREPRTYYLGSNVQPRIADFMALSAEAQAHYELVVGHMSYGLHASLPPTRPHRYFTMLRDPIERVISLYFFIKRTPNHYLYDPVVTENYTIAQFLAYEGSYMARNAQTRFLCGRDVMPYVGSIDDEALEAAKTNIRDHILVTGLTERFDESLLLYRHAFGWRQIHYTRQNVTSNRKKQDDLSAEDLAALNAHTAYDQALPGFFGLVRPFPKVRTVSVRTKIKQWLGRA